MSNLDTMFAAYKEAIDFTECGDAEQPEHGAELTAYHKSRSYLDCRQFYWAVTENISRTSLLDTVEIDWAQAGHDLWLTRNGHGAGFWDRPEIYGEDLCHVLSALAKAMGSHDVEFEGQEIPL